MLSGMLAWQRACLPPSLTRLLRCLLAAGWEQASSPVQDTSVQ